MSPMLPGVESVQLIAGCLEEAGNASQNTKWMGNTMGKLKKRSDLELKKGITEQQPDLRRATTERQPNLSPARSGGTPVRATSGPINGQETSGSLFPTRADASLSPRFKQESFSSRRRSGDGCGMQRRRSEAMLPSLSESRVDAGVGSKEKHLADELGVSPRAWGRRSVDGMPVPASVRNRAAMLNGALPGKDSPSNRKVGSSMRQRVRSEAQLSRRPSSNAHDRELSPINMKKMSRMRHMSDIHTLSLQENQQALMNGLQKQGKHTRTLQDSMGLDVDLQELVTPPESGRSNGGNAHRGPGGRPGSASVMLKRLPPVRPSIEQSASDKVMAIVGKWRKRKDDQSGLGKSGDAEEQVGAPAGPSDGDADADGDRQTDNAGEASPPSPVIVDDNYILVEYAPAFEKAFAVLLDDIQDPREEKRRHFTFRRFTPPGAVEVPTSDVHNILQQLGMLSFNEETVAEVCASATKYSDVDWVDFYELIDKFGRRYREEAKQRTQEFLSQKDGTTFDGVQRLLRTFNIFIGNKGVELALQNAGLELGDIKKSDDLLKVLAGCRVNEGFSQEEVASAQDIFEGLEKQPREQNLIQANQLSSGLLEFEGLYCVDNLAILMKLFPSVADDAPGINFWEFLAWARRLRHMGRLALNDGWIEADPEKIGLISVSSASKMASKLGYTLLTDVVNDILKENCELKGGRLDWNAALCFVSAIYEKLGFTEAETEEMGAVYNKFDYEGEGELTTLQVLDLLRYLGYKTRADQVHALIKRVDFNQNGSMDLNEFLMLMRLMRENYIQQVREAFSAAAENGQDIPLSKVVGTVLQLGEKPPEDTVSELLEGAPEKVDFERFASLADKFRECSTVEGRKRANFEDGVFRDLKKVFKGHDPHRKLLKMGELLWNLSESMVPVNTAEGRQHVFTQVEAARQAAQDAGVPDNEVGEKGETVGFYTFVHLMRRLVSDYEQKALKREHDVIKSSNLTKEESSEFRHLFSSLLDEYGDGKKCGAKPRNRSSRTIGGLLEKILSAPIVPEQALLFMLKTIGLRMSATQLVELNSKIQEYNQSGTDGWIDFVCFVQVMRWMLEVNHAGINKKVGNLVGSSAPKSE